jgi:hypothetical protein
MYSEHGQHLDRCPLHIRSSSTSLSQFGAQGLSVHAYGRSFVWDDGSCCQVQKRYRCSDVDSPKKRQACHLVQMVVQNIQRELTKVLRRGGNVVDSIRVLLLPH